MAFKMKPGRGNFPKTGHGAPLNMINEGPGDDTKNKKNQVSGKKEQRLDSVNKPQKKYSEADEKLARDIANEVNKGYKPEELPKGIDLGEYKKFIKPGNSTRDSRTGELNRVYTPVNTKLVVKEQFENYANRLKKMYPEETKKIQFKYNQ